MNVFIVHVARDADKLPPIIDGLKGIGHSVTFDDRGSGDQVWWDGLLDQIAGSDAVLLAISPATLESDPYMRQVEYARQLEKAVLPIMVNRIRPELLPSSIAVLQIVDFCDPDDLQSSFSFLAAVSHLPPPPPMPVPPPARPPLPVSLIDSISHALQQPDLTPDEQWTLVVKLRGVLNRRQDRAAIIELIRTFTERDDLLDRVAQELATMKVPDERPEDRRESDLAPRPSVAAPSRETASLGAAPGFYPDPQRRHQERFWSGDAWTSRVRDGGIENFDDVGRSQPVTTSTPKSSNSRWWVGGAVVGILFLIGLVIAIASGGHPSSSNSYYPTSDTRSPAPAVTSTPLNPQLLIMPLSSDLSGYSVDIDQTSSQNGWRGWRRLYRGGATTHYYWIEFYVYILPTGTRPADAIKQAICDLYFSTPPTPTTSGGPGTLGSAANVCVYTFSAGDSVTEYQAVDSGVLIDVAVAPRDVNNSTAFNLTVTLTTQEISFVRQRIG